MSQPGTAEFCAQLEASAAAIAAPVGAGELGTPIPTCPEWTLRELAVHVGRAHRWAAQITATRSPEFIEFRSLPDGRFPGEAAAQARWVTAGARRAAESITGAGEDPVWMLGRQLPASRWARRMCHETVVHEADVVLARGQQPAIAPAIAADAIDEWLTDLLPLLWSQSDHGQSALEPGASLHVHATDDGLDGAGEWRVSRGADGITAERAHARADAALTGPAGKLLLVLLRRASADDPAVTVHGDPSALDRWLAETKF